MRKMRNKNWNLVAADYGDEMIMVVGMNWENDKDNYCISILHYTIL